MVELPPWGRPLGQREPRRGRRLCPAGFLRPCSQAPAAALTSLIRAWSFGPRLVIQTTHSAARLPESISRRVVRPRTRDSDAPAVDLDLGRMPGVSVVIVNERSSRGLPVETTIPTPGLPSDPPPKPYREVRHAVVSVAVGRVAHFALVLRPVVAERVLRAERRQHHRLRRRRLGTGHADGVGDEQRTGDRPGDQEQAGHGEA